MLRPGGLIVFALLYFLTGLGVTVGSTDSSRAGASERGLRFA